MTTDGAVRPLLATDRLVLRPHDAGDFEALASLHQHPVVVPNMSGSAPSREDCWNRLLRYVGHWALFGFGMFAATERASGRLIGDVGLADFGRGLGEAFDGFAEAAWIFHPDAHGRGLAAEGVAAVHAWLETQRGRQRTVCIIKPENAPSLRLAARFDYRPFDRRDYKGATFLMLQRPTP